LRVDFSDSRLESCQLRSLVFRRRFTGASAPLSDSSHEAGFSFLLVPLLSVAAPTAISMSVEFSEFMYAVSGRNKALMVIFSVTFMGVLGILEVREAVQLAYF